MSNSRKMVSPSPLRTPARCRASATGAGSVSQFACPESDQPPPSPFSTCVLALSRKDCLFCLSLVSEGLAHVFALYLNPSKHDHFFFSSLLTSSHPSVLFLPNFLRLQIFFCISVYFLACIALDPQTQRRGSLQATWICCGVILLVMSTTGCCVLDATKIVLGITYQEG